MIRKPSIVSLRKQYPFLPLLTDEELDLIISTAPVYQRREYFRFVFDKEKATRLKKAEDDAKARALEEVLRPNSNGDDSGGSQNRTGTLEDGQVPTQGGNQAEA